MPRIIRDGDTVTQDANEALIYEFDYDALGNLAEGVELSGVGTITITPTSGMTADNATLASDGRSITVRVSGGQRGRAYELRHTGTTTEAVPQTKSKWVKLLIT